MPLAAAAAPFAAYVMDGRSGRELYSKNAESRLHPASLTKMMTLYIAFQDVERGRVRLDSRFTITKKAAGEPPSKLGLRAGQKIELRYLIRAAAVKSANDAATAIAEGLGGSEAAFAQRMTATAQAMGMRNTRFRNANGLTEEGHYSTAHDMSILGRHVFYDYPQYYSIFSRRSADAGVAQVRNTNRRFLDSYQGADGIKTGYTRAAGFNLTASAQRGGKRIIATVMGGQSTAHRNQIMAQLLDSGFSKAPRNAREVKPARPQVIAQPKVRRTIQVARAKLPPPPKAAPAALASLAAPQRFAPSSAARPLPRMLPARSAEAADAVEEAVAAAALRSSGSGEGLKSSTRPQRRPGAAEAPASTTRVAEMPAAETDPAAASTSGIARSSRPVAAPNRDETADASAATDAAGTDPGTAVAAAPPSTPAAAPAAAPVRLAAAEPLPAAQPGAVSMTLASTAGTGPIFLQTTQAQPESLALEASDVPDRRSDTVILASLDEEGDAGEPLPVETVRRSSDLQGNASITIGRYKSQREAEQVLLQAALADSDLLDLASSGVANTMRGFEPRFSGLSAAAAELACGRIQARRQLCSVSAP